MSLSYNCGDDDPNSAEWFCTMPNDFKPLQTKYRRRCKSCNELIDVGALCLSFERAREPLWDIEEEIYGSGSDVPLTTWYHCEKCGKKYLNLTRLDFCVDIDEDMRELTEEYLQDYNPTWKKPIKST